MCEGERKSQAEVCSTPSSFSCVLICMDVCMDLGGLGAGGKRDLYYEHHF